MLEVLLDGDIFTYHIQEVLYNQINLKNAVLKYPTPSTVPGT